MMALAFIAGLAIGAGIASIAIASTLYRLAKALPAAKPVARIERPIFLSPEVGSA